MRTAALLTISLSSLLASCGGGGSTEAPAAEASAPAAQVAPAMPSDLDIIGKLYDPNYSVPDGFFVDERAGTAQSYTIHHVLDPSGAWERCTDDFTQAAAWEDEDNASRSVSGYYVGSVENEQYFEFIRELSYNNDVGNISDPTSPGYARVFKCSHLSRDNVDRADLSGYAGTLNARPFLNDTVADFAEYFWQFTFFPQRYRKVLDTWSSNSGAEHTLLLGFASTQGTGQCDLVELVEWTFTADSSNGRVESEFRLVRSFRAELADGSPRLCGDATT